MGGEWEREEGKRKEGRGEEGHSLVLAYISRDMNPGKKSRLRHIDVQLQHRRVSWSMMSMGDVASSSDMH